MVFMVLVVFFEAKLEQLIDLSHISAWDGGYFRSPKIWNPPRPQYLDPVHDGGVNRTKFDAPPPVYVKAMPNEFFKTDIGLDPRHPPLKTILIWVDGYGAKTLSYGFGRAPFQKAKCEVDTCMVTANRSFVPLEEFDALVFHFRVLEPTGLPKRRSPHQRWIFWEVESASYVYQSPSIYNGLFNWTMTYRRDSDIPYPYGRTYAILPSVVPAVVPAVASPHRNYADGKTKMAAWFVSNCFSISRREKIVRFMKKFIQVDVYGKCGPLKCSRENTTECYKMLEKDYKFYLSFENSLCRDYVTEKLFSVLRYDVVPVVLGLGDYVNIAPPRSFINAVDFKSLQDLTAYLKYLDTNDTAYNEYFRWKDHYVVDDGWSSTAHTFCNLCKKLHQDTTPKVYTDMRQWFVTNGGCKKLDMKSWFTTVN
ncbi:alpha-(1,3)-fucosyltransferase C isoform X2 [Procambarus clarkii]